MARPVIGNSEQDVHTRFRALLCWTQRAGACRKVKRRTNRRDRHQARARIRRTFTHPAGGTDEH